MPSLLIVKALDAGSAQSPELQYLLSHCLLEAREVFDSVDLAVAEDPPEPLAGGRFDAVLLVSSGNVLLCRRSLAAMWALLRTGLQEVRPYRLAEAGVSFPIYTLRGYERAERAFLETSPAGVPLNPSRAPVSLLTFDHFRQLPAEGGNPRIGHAGLFHEFIDYYGEVRSDILPFVPADAREVLEVGCGRGVTGRLLQETLGCRVTGVELNPVVAREAARHLHRVIQGDVQDLEIEGGYDVVIALELVEHLVETEAFLARIQRLLAPGGRAILSIPNVGHYSIVEDLIAGRWDYLPIGLLCYTHYRFFTRRTLADWLRRAGIEKFELVPQKTELPDWFRELPARFEADPESLATKGFYVLIHG
ncbi:MAG TPA: class I SAM-dependent methyltransferase [Thermoanaerobaculia bacterium]|jgi:SAM-dependent methyltransferase|nr:class I SAM-dependent methyltransferase [Thermoanaerobaculia bacterium]